MCTKLENLPEGYKSQFEGIPLPIWGQFEHKISNSNERK